MTVKTAARQTAELFRSLAAAASLEPDDGIVDLVLDGILEVESRNGFVSGADALPILDVPAGEIRGVLSHEALLHAQALMTSDPQKLAMGLYQYNQIPVSRFWRTRFAGPEDVLAHVGADRGALRKLLERHWTRSELGNVWLCWMANDDDARYKLYVSPRPDHIRPAFEALVRVLSEVPATFKMGSNAAALLRPDKLCAYFVTREALDEAASKMRRALAGCDAQGVPFTAALDESGLLSWGVDPPESERVLRWLERQSWRLWIAQRLGGAMAIAKAARTSSAVEPWKFAVARLQRLGVDIDTWT